MEYPARVRYMGQLMYCCPWCRSLYALKSGIEEHKAECTEKPQAAPTGGRKGAVQHGKPKG